MNNKGLVIDLMSVPRAMIGPRRFPTPQTDLCTELPEVVGPTALIGCTRAHGLAAQWALLQPGPVLLLENDAVPLEWYAQSLPPLPTHTDILFLGLLDRGMGQQLDLQYKRIPFGVKQWGAHAQVLLTEAGKLQWLASANADRSIDEDVHIVGQDVSRLALRKPMFCQYPYDGGRNGVNRLSFVDAHGTIGRAVLPPESIELLPVRLTNSAPESIDGWMFPVELKWLEGAAGRRMRVLELGSWKGRSSAAIARGLPAGGVLTCLDTWRGSDSERAHDHAKDPSDPIWCEFQENHRLNLSTGRVVPLRKTTTAGMAELAAQGAQFDMIFIDAEHTYEACSSDIQGALKLLAPGGLLCGHDYCWFDGVRKAASEVGGVPAGAASIWHVPVA